MTRRQASGTCLFALLGLLLPACAPINHSAEIEQAAKRVEEITGRNPDWQAAPSVALAVDPSGVLTLDECIRLGLRNNRGLRAELEVIGQAKAELVQSGLLPNPMLSMSFGLPDGGGLADLTFGLSQDLAAIWLIPSRVAAARAALQQRILALADAALELTTEIRTRYATLQYLSLATRLQEQNLHIVRQAMEIAQAKLRVGTASQLDLNLIQGRSLETELELLRIRSEFETTQRTLLRLLGYAQASAEWRPGEMGLAPAPPALAESEEHLIEVALLQRLDLQAADFEREAALAELDEQRRRVIQSLGIGIVGERFERRAPLERKLRADTARASLAAGELAVPEVQTAGQRRMERSQEIETVLGPSFEMSLPLFDQNQARIAKAQFRARELHERYLEAEQRIIESVRIAIAQWRLATDRARIFGQSLLPLQESNLVLAETSYRAGRESVLTVLLAQESLIRTRLEQAATLRDLEISLANLERQLAGRLVQPTAASTQPASQPGASVPNRRSRRA